MIKKTLYALIFLAIVLLSFFSVSSWIGMNAYLYGNLSVWERWKFNSIFEEAVNDGDFSDPLFDNAAFYCIETGLAASPHSWVNEFAQSNGLDLAIPIYESPLQDISSYVLVRRDGSHAVTFSGGGIDDAIWYSRSNSQIFCQMFPSKNS